MDFLFQYSVRTSPFRSATYNLCCKTEKFEAIIFPHRNRRRCLRTVDTKTNTLEPNTCVNLEVLKIPLTLTLTSTIQARPLETMFAYSAYHLILHWNHYLCSSALSHWLATVSSLTVLGTFPAVPVLLTLSLPCFFYKKAPTPIGPPHFKLLPSSLVDLDIAIWFFLMIQ
jgi:hypothetical protein